MKQAGRIKQLFHNAGIAIVEVDRKARISYLNRGAQELLGVSTEEAAGMHVWEFLKGKRPEFDSLVQLLTESPGGLSDIPVNIVGQRIKSLWAEICITPFYFDENDNGHLIFLKDITRRKIADDRIKETTNILINVLNDSADAILGITLDNRFFLWNRGAESVFGYSAEEMMDKPVALLIPDDLRDKNELTFFSREALKKGYVQDFVTDRIRKDGKRITVNITRTVIRNVNGQNVGFSAIVRDITRQQDLQQQVLQSERLSVVGRMAAQVAHEIRNPLSSIILNLELMDDELDELTGQQVSELRNLLSTIETEVNHLSNLTDDYLSFVRMPAPSRSVVSPYALIEEVLRLMQPTAAENRVTLELEPREVPVISADRNQIRRAIMNIIKNGIEASEPDSTVKTWCSVTRDGRFLLINVQDFGTGIPADVCDKVFDLFYTTKLTGSGLGMHITRQILQEHGGDVQMSSREGQGTLVQLKLPLGA